MGQAYSTTTTSSVLVSESELASVLALEQAAKELIKAIMATKPKRRNKLIFIDVFFNKSKVEIAQNRRDQKDLSKLNNAQ